MNIKFGLIGIVLGLISLGLSALSLNSYVFRADAVTLYIAKFLAIPLRIFSSKEHSDPSFQTEHWFVLNEQNAIYFVSALAVMFSFIAVACAIKSRLCLEPKNISFMPILLATTPYILFDIRIAFLVFLAFTSAILITDRKVNQVGPTTP